MAANTLVIPPQVVSSYWAAAAPLSGWTYVSSTGTIALWCVRQRPLSNAPPRHASRAPRPLTRFPLARRVAFACTLFSAVVFLFL